MKGVVTMIKFKKMYEQLFELETDALSIMGELEKLDMKTAELQDVYDFSYIYQRLVKALSDTSKEFNRLLSKYEKRYNDFDYTYYKLYLRKDK